MPSVLVIDDDEMILNISTELIESSGCIVYATADGPHAIELFKEYRPDVVVLDLGLPSMDGLTVLEEIREIDRNVPIIIFSGYLSPEYRKLASHHAPVQCFAKGAETEQFVQFLNNRIADLNRKR